MSNRMGAVRQHDKEVIVADGDRFYSPKVPEGQKWWIESTSAFNDTTDNSECLVSIERGGSLTPVKQFLNLTVDLWSTKFVRLWLFPGERLAFTWTGSTAADLIEFSFVGHRQIEN